MKNNFKLTTFVVLSLGSLSAFNESAFAQENPVKVVTADQVAQCRKLQVCRGKSDQPLFSTNSVEQLESEAMQDLIQEARDVEATHVVKGFTYRVGNPTRLDFVFQFGTAYDCAPKSQD